MKKLFSTFAILLVLAGVWLNRERLERIALVRDVQAWLGLGTSAGDQDADSGDNSSRGGLEIEFVPAKSGSQLVSDTLKKLLQRQGIRAQVRQSTILHGRELHGAGTYLQGPPDSRRIRLEVTLQMDGKGGSIQQVCDGQWIWTRQQLHNSATLYRVDLERAMKIPHGGDVNLPRLGYGGLPRLIESLEQSWDFSAPRRGRLDDLEVLIVEGQWKPRPLKYFLPDSAASIDAGDKIDFKKLPPQVPFRVQLMLGKEDLFPYRIEFHPHPAAGEKPLVVLEFFHVELEARLNQQLFSFNPESQRAIDQTEAFVGEFP